MSSVQITFLLPNSTSIVVDAPIGISLLELAHRNKFPLEGACEGSLACSTCHIIFESEHFNNLKEPSEEEEDMLDLAFGLTKTSRLGCQIIVDKNLDGAVVRIPSVNRNFNSGTSE
jgi:2Fe-2S ferredoxin